MTAVALGSVPVLAFVVANAQTLTMFVEQTFHNPTLVKIIEIIATVGGAY